MMRVILSNLLFVGMVWAQCPSPAPQNPTCKDNEILCPMPPDNNWCPRPGYCIEPKGWAKDNNGKDCDFPGCKAACGPGQRHCNGQLDQDGCPTQDWCLTSKNWATDINGNYCPDHTCPMMCTKDQIQCWGGFDNLGCPIGDICVGPPGQDIFGKDCPHVCPTVCKQDEIVCPSAAVAATGCPSQGWCMPRDSGLCDKFSLTPCPDNTCPPICNHEIGEIPCKDPSWNGCQPKEYCFNEQPMQDNWGHECPKRGCQVKCDDAHMLCPGGKDEMGCPKQDHCIPKETGIMDIHGNMCPAVCPEPCDLATQMQCHGGKDQMNCPTGPHCMSKEPALDNNCEECPVFCENRDCGPNMIFCEKEPDAKGCRPPGGCMDTKSGLIMKDGTPCPPKTCPRICGKDEMKCIYPDVWNGCEPIEECLTKQINYDMNGKECHSFCPAKCGPDELMCSGGKDNFGCPKGDFCTPKSSGNMGMDGHECPAHCPQACDESIEKSCSSGLDHQGCPMPSRCIPLKGEIGKDGKECPVHCEDLNCGPDSMWCDKGFDPVTGCKWPGYCQSSKGQPPYRPFDVPPAPCETCPGVCPIDCQDPNFPKKCHGGFDNRGCRLPDSCHPDNYACFAKCPPGMRDCPGFKDENTGNPVDGFCIPNEKDYGKGAICKEECQLISCPKGFVPCPQFDHITGCPLPTTCQDKC